MASIPELVVKPLHGEAYHFPLEKDVISIGRSKRNDLVLADQWLSRHHAELRSDEGDFTIADLESRNGTYVNGEKIARIIPLQNDDVITLGDQQLTFVDDASGNVRLTPGGFDTEGTVVLPTKQLLAAARPQEDTWDNMGDRSPAKRVHADESARIRKPNQILSALSGSERITPDFSAGCRV